MCKGKLLWVDIALGKAVCIFLVECIDEAEVLPHSCSLLQVMSEMRLWYFCADSMFVPLRAFPMQQVELQRTSYISLLILPSSVRSSFLAIFRMYVCTHLWALLINEASPGDLG